MSQIFSAHESYDGRPDPNVPVRLIQQVDSPCWQVHAYLRFIRQPYWTENIEFHVALGTDTPVLVDRRFVMTAQPAIRCIEELAASSSDDCNLSFERYNAVFRLEGLWCLLESSRETNHHNMNINFASLGMSSLSKMYANLRKHIYLTRTTPAYLSHIDLQNAVNTSYSYLSDHIVKCTGTCDTGMPYFLSGGSSPGLADALLFSHLVEVALSKTDIRGLSRIQKEFPALHKYFIRLCQDFFHARPEMDNNFQQFLFEANSSLLHCMLVSHGAESLQPQGQLYDFVMLLFGERFFSYRSNIYHFRSQREKILVVPHYNEHCRLNRIPLLRADYRFDISSLTSIIFKNNSENNGKSNINRPIENYVGVRCLAFSSFVAYCFLKSLYDIAVD